MGSEPEPMTESAFADEAVNGRRLFAVTHSAIATPYASTTETADYLLSFERLQHYGDYFVLNVSSPNTPGLRTLQDRPALDELIG